MSVYMLAGTDVHDPEAHQAYIQAAIASLEGFDASIKALCDENKTVEGRKSPGRLIIVEFGSRAEFDRWYESETYVNARPLRHSTAATDHLWVTADA
ncbi:DUF1330 domain-containing protein [Amycolatopsis sp. NPDC051903]|uniref:DUF1330 domain-containing protein n=1 Tax=Amycolatopsis sp. NPDC051903 TaxID=3363936 RepID=UPI003793520D